MVTSLCATTDRPMVFSIAKLGYWYYITGLIILLGVLNTSVTANVATTLQEKLESELTPFGAVRAGNNAGTIPGWTKEPVVNYTNQPLFVITVKNLEQHKQHLTAGQLALFARYPDSFNMPIYQTQRSAIAPDWVYRNTAKNITDTTLNKDQTGFDNALGGIPFAIPASAIEVYFNHIGRWRGQQLQSRTSDAVVLKNGTFTLITSNILVRFDSYIADLRSNYFISVLAKTIAPASRSGAGVLVLEPLDQLNKNRAAWLWDKGRRRAIRAPNADLVNGSPDRFEWQLLEKREIYIAYNNNQLASKKLKYRDILHKFHINPQHTRYELHRVWVIRAILKDKWRHVYSRRDFYIDEDSWQVVIADQYNTHGELWRVSMSYPKYDATIPSIFPVINVFHDLMSKKYHVMGLQNEQDSDNIFNGEIAKGALFTPAGFKRYMR